MADALPETMIAVEIVKPGGPEVLLSTRRPVPQPGRGEMVISVAAAGVNRPDVLQRLGLYPLPPGASDLPGLEVAGRVAALGDGVTGWRIGDPVTALCNGGGYAEFVAVPAGQCLPAPAGLSMIEAAALPETCFTVWGNVFDRGRLMPGETLLVHGGASGIGTTAIQMAVAKGARVLATAGGPEKCRACERLGASRAIDYRSEDFVAAVNEATGGKGADVILDMVGGDYAPRNLDCLAVDGRVVQIAFLRGNRVEIDLMALMRKRATLTGSTLRPQSDAAKAAIAAALGREIWPLIEQGRIRPAIHATFPLAEAAEAHRAIDAGDHIGKIVLVVR